MRCTWLSISGLLDWIQCLFGSIVRNNLAYMIGNDKEELLSMTFISVWNNKWMRCCWESEMYIHFYITDDVSCRVVLRFMRALIMYDTTEEEQSK